MDREKYKKRLDLVLAAIGVVSVFLFFITIGYELSDAQIYAIEIAIFIVAIIFILQELARWTLQKKPLQYLKTRWLENLLALVLILDMIFPGTVQSLLSNIAPGLEISQITLAYLGVIQFIIIGSILIRTLRYSHLISKLQLHPGAIFAISFAMFIILGAILLSLPNSTPKGSSISLIDALFTSTSSVCVTGLIVLDTAADFTLMGKVIILILLQIGGLGVMTLTSFFAFFLSGGVSLRFKILMKDLLSEEGAGKLKNLLKSIFIYTIIIEIIGAFFLYLSLGGSFEQMNIHYLWTSVFHSVSAFCNAGFSIYSAGLMEAQVAGNYYFSTIVMALIILGGLGFAVLTDLTLISPLKKRGIYSKRSTPTTKLVLITTAVLITLGALLIFFAESFDFNESYGFAERLYHSLFLSVTSRTAGFNTIPTGSLTNAVVMITIVLMWIGASPGSTGGGIKTTTFSITFLSLFNIMRGKDKVEIFDREVSPHTVRKAFNVIFASLIFLAIGSTALIWIEPDKEPLDLIFEACSAISTVGLTRDVTPSLGAGGKFVVVLLMYIGRIGVLTFFLAFVRTATKPRYSLPKTEIMVG